MATTTTNTGSTVDYWEDDWERQADMVELEHYGISHICDTTDTKKSNTKTSWEDEDEDENENEAYQEWRDHHEHHAEDTPKVADTPKVVDTPKVARRHKVVELKDVEKHTVEKPKPTPKTWAKISNGRTTDEYKQSYPELNQQKADDKKNTRARHNHKVEVSKKNIYMALVEDDYVPPPPPLPPPQRQVQPEQRRQSNYKSGQISPQIRTKSRLCRCVTDGSVCTFGQRCRYAHSTNELRPDTCRNGQKCRCVVINYDKSVVNNQRSRRVCMFTHDESHRDYLKRTGLDRYNQPSISVPNNFVMQATEMARITGACIRTL
jgi:hypothetical protein